MGKIVRFNITQPSLYLYCEGCLIFCGHLWGARKVQKWRYARRINVQSARRCIYFLILKNSVQQSKKFASVIGKRLLYVLLLWVYFVRRNITNEKLLIKITYTSSIFDYWAKTTKMLVKEVLPLRIWLVSINIDVNRQYKFSQLQIVLVRYSSCTR